MYILTVCLYEKFKGGGGILQYYDKSKQVKNSMYRSTKQANGLVLFFIQSCCQSTWRGEDGTCSASARGLHLPYTILHCDWNNNALAGLPFLFAIV